MLTSRSGRRSNGDRIGSATSVRWLPPPVPLCRPSRAKVSAQKLLLAGDPVERLNQVGKLGPAGGWMNIHLDHSGIGSDQQGLDPRVGRWPIAFQERRRCWSAPQPDRPARPVR